MERVATASDSNKACSKGAANNKLICNVANGVTKPDSALASDLPESEPSIVKQNSQAAIVVPLATN